jgi:hypothetical protein
MNLQRVLAVPQVKWYLLRASLSTGGAQYVTLDNKIKCLSLAVLFFGDPTNKTVTGTAYTLGTTNSKPPGPIIMIDQSEILSRSQVQFITLFLDCSPSSFSLMGGVGKKS